MHRVLRWVVYPWIWEFRKVSKARRSVSWNLFGKNRCGNQGFETMINFERLKRFCLCKALLCQKMLTDKLTDPFCVHRKLRKTMPRLIPEGANTFVSGQTDDVRRAPHTRTYCVPHLIEHSERIRIQRATYLKRLLQINTRYLRFSCFITLKYIQDQ